MLSKKHYTLLLYLAFGLHVFSQTSEEILSKVYETYNNSSYLQFATNYKLYKTVVSETPVEITNGYFYKNKVNAYFMTISTTDILGDELATLKINHSEKAILITPPIIGVPDDFDIRKFLISYTSDKITDNGSYWEIVLKAKQLSQEQFYKIVIHITKDYLLKKQYFYYANQMNFSNDYHKTDLSQPKLEVAYTNYKSDIIDEFIFDSSKFMKFSKNGNIKLSEKYSDYKVLDRRENNTHKKK